MATALFSNPLTAKSTDAIAPEMKGFDPAQQAVLKAEQEQERYKTFQDLTKSEEQKMLTEGTAKATETYAKEAQPKELTDELKKKVEDTSTPFIPTQQTAGDLGTIFAITNILGFAIGRGAKGSAQAALSAQNGMLEGYQKGQMDVYKKQKDVFDENQKALSKAIEGLKYELTQAEKTASVNKELAMSQVQQAISRHGADTLGKYIDQFGLPKGVEYVKSLERMDKENQDRILKNRRMAIEEERLAEANKGTYQYVVGKDGKTYAISNKNPNDIREVKTDLSGSTKVGAKDKMTEPTQLGGNSLLKDVIGKTAKTDKIAGDINNNAMAVTRIDNLLTRLQDPEIRSGVQSKLSTIKEQAKSMFGEQGEMSTEQVNSLINNVVNPTDKNAVFQKDALFTAFEAERAAQGGRLTVQMMKQAGSVLDPTNYTKEGYAGVLGGRRQTLVNNLKSQNLNDEDIGKLTKHFAQPQPGISGTDVNTQKQSAPQSAIDHLKSHPELKNDFKDKYGYLPEGM